VKRQRERVEKKSMSEECPVIRYEKKAKSDQIGDVNPVVDLSGTQP